MFKIIRKTLRRPMIFFFDWYLIILEYYEGAFLKCNWWDVKHIDIIVVLFYVCIHINIVKNIKVRVICQNVAAHFNSVWCNYHRQIALHPKLNNSARAKSLFALETLLQTLPMLQWKNNGFPNGSFHI